MCTYVYIRYNGYTVSTAHACARDRIADTGQHYIHTYTHTLHTAPPCVEPQSWFVHRASLRSPHIHHLSRRSFFFSSRLTERACTVLSLPAAGSTAPRPRHIRRRCHQPSGPSVVPTTLHYITPSSSSNRPTAVIGVMSPLLASVKQRPLMSLPILEEAKCSRCPYTLVLPDSPQLSLEKDAE